MRTKTHFLLLMIITLGLTIGGCGSTKQQTAPQLEEMKVQKAQPTRIRKNHFKSDHSGNITEEKLRRILDSEVYLEEEARLGIVPVATAYEADKDLPLTSVPKALSSALEDTGFFEVTTEVSTDWPKDRSVAGLRELAARYRANYLLLYRHRFENRKRVNGWGWASPTIVGALTLPLRTVEVAGVMEATLFDPRTGTILFTAYERVRGEEKMTVWNNRHKRREMKERLLRQATEKLSGKVTHKVRRLISAHPTNSGTAHRSHAKERNSERSVSQR